MTPFFGDQPYWGRRIFELGVGPKPIPKKRLDAEKLGQAISTAVTDDVMKEKAAELASRIQSEDGVVEAVKVLEQVSNSA